MLIFVLTLVVVMLSILGMAVGVLFGRRPLREGGCGNLNGIAVCDVCGATQDEPADTFEPGRRL
ncbi:MAG: hypothetical protein HOL85_17290 [Rhodospirillaceae bacterium]|jgi:uncharacterized protein|nr:hypothetical protein [Rhodospirillaceae bacterium]MBT6139742.1 hypothetical protein [Rhodospirillaceae bacterium]